MCVSRTLEAVDGIFLVTAESYEPDAVAPTKTWFAEKGRPAYVCGPLLPSASKSTAIANEKKLSADSPEIQTFLDESLRTSGENLAGQARSPSSGPLLKVWASSVQRRAPEVVLITRQ